MKNFLKIAVTTALIAFLAAGCGPDTTHPSLEGDGPGQGELPGAPDGFSMVGSNTQLVESDHRVSVVGFSPAGIRKVVGGDKYSGSDPMTELEVEVLKDLTK